MKIYERSFNEARKLQGFASQAHLDAFFTLFDHVESCPMCKARDGFILLDDGYQPTGGRCDEARRLDQLISEVSQ